MSTGRSLAAHDGDLAPWVDQDSFEEIAGSRQAAGELPPERVDALRAWRAQGFLELRGAIPPNVVDELRADYERAWTERPEVYALVEGEGEVLLPDVAERSTLTHHHYRFMDFHEHAASARAIMFAEPVTEALTAIFGSTPVAMQSLLFEYGSEQGLHQDFPYVSAQVLSQLVGCWVALDDVDDDNGPLFYMEGSHRLPCYDWGGGELRFDGADPAAPTRFAEYLEAASAEAGLARRVLHARKGDVLLWHAALAHGGSPVVDATATRMSLVAHYSTESAYPVDRRFPTVQPVIERIGGGIMYRRPEPGSEQPVVPPAPEPEQPPDPPPSPPSLWTRLRRRLGA